MDVMVLRWICDPEAGPYEELERVPGVSRHDVCYPGGMGVHYTNSEGDSRMVWANQMPWQRLVEVSFEHESDEPAE